MSDVPLLSVHDSWISLDPVTGCVANCEYCYLGPMKLRGKIPEVRRSVEEAVAELLDFPAVHSTQIPICVGNYTDMLMRPADREYTLGLLSALSESLPNRTICVVTKATIDAGLARTLQSVCPSLVVYLSQSFAREVGAHVERGPIASLEATLESARSVSAQESIRAVHFWRPFLAAFNPMRDLPLRLDLLQDAGMSGSVVIGLKLANHRSDVSQVMSTIAREGMDELTASGDEIIYSEGFTALAALGRDLGYAILRNTTCSHAVLAAAPEATGTRWGPVAGSRCLNVSCPPAQRSICDSSDARWPEAGAVRGVAASLGISSDIVVDAGTGFARASDLAEGQLNALTHALGVTVLVEELDHEKVWSGATAGLHENTRANALMLSWPKTGLGLQDGLIDRLARLKGITGFLTTLHSRADRRAEVFSRFEHVQRVVWLTKVLAEGQPDLAEQAEKYAWIHDLNRWAFAHNAERGRFNQVSNIESYFQPHEEVSPAERRQLALFHRRDIGRLDDSALLACTADMLAGTIEDPLLLTGGLNIAPRIVRDPAKLGFVDFGSSAVLEELSNLAAALHSVRSPTLFRQQLSNLFTRHAEEVVRDLRLDIDLRSKAPALFQRIRDYKSHVMSPIIFPINNDLVCHAENIRSLVVEPLHSQHGELASEMLLSVTEDSLVSDLVAAGTLSAAEASGLAPALDGIARLVGTDPLV